MTLTPPALPLPQPPLHGRGGHPVLCTSQDAKYKSHNCFFQSGYRVLEMPLLWLMLMLQRIIKEEEEAFWYGLDVVMGEELELSLPPPNI